jgi:hypothetical protein
MKKLAIVMITISFTGAVYAQQMVEGGVDSVVVGSTMPYAVTPDATIAAMTSVMNPSQFRWMMTDESDNVVTTGFTIAETPAAGLYAEDSINVTWTGAAGSTYKVKTTEVSQPKYGASCDGNITELFVEVLDVPSVGLNGSGPFQSSGCGLTGDTISVDVSGIGPWDVTFSVEFDDNGSPTEFTETIGSIGMNGSFTLDLVLNDVNHLTNGSGKYDVNLINVVDRISSKSLTNVPGTVKTTGEYVIGIYPAPNTGAIRHINN